MCCVVCVLFCCWLGASVCACFGSCVVVLFRVVVLDVCCCFVSVCGVSVWVIALKLRCCFVCCHVASCVRLDVCLFFGCAVREFV